MCVFSRAPRETVDVAIHSYSLVGMKRGDVVGGALGGIEDAGEYGINQGIDARVPGS
jgi:hypothetical protein